MDSESNYFERATYLRKEVARFNQHSAHVLTASKEKMVDALFNAAQTYLVQGNYQQALLLGLKCRELNFQPAGKIDYFLSIIISKMQQ